MIENPQKWVMYLIFIIFFPITACSIYLTWRYQIDGIDSMVISDGEKWIRKFCSGVLMAAHVGFVFVIAILVGRQFIGWKTAMWFLAAAIWAFEGSGMYFFRFAMMDKANSTMVTQAERVEDRRSTMKGLQENAKSLRDGAPRLLANKRITEANDNLKEAKRLEDRAADLEEKLQAMPTGAGTSEVKAWGGEDGARWRAIAEAALVSFVLVVCSTMTGISLRHLYGNPQQAVVVKRPAPSHPGIRRFSPRQLGGIFFKKKTESEKYESEPKKAADAAPKRTPKTPEKTYSPPVVESEIVLAQVRSEEKLAKTSDDDTCPDGVRIAIESGACRPSIGALIDSFRVGQQRATSWLNQLGAAGVIIKRKSGVGWILNPANNRVRVITEKS